MNAPIEPIARSSEQAPDAVAVAVAALSPGRLARAVAVVAPALALSLALALASLVAATRAEAQRVAPCTGGPTLHAVVAPVLPRAFAPESVQAGADCVSWQMFIALNWQAGRGRAGTPSSAPAAAFGTPGDTAPTVWQSYPLASAVFAAPLRAGAGASGARSATAGAAPTLLHLRDISQSGGGWLTTQSGSPTYYEVRVNPDEAEYIRDNGLTTFAGQAACVRGKGGFNLPHGSTTGSGPGGPDTDCLGNPRRYGQDVGAIEIKAAWIVLPADGSLDHRYKIARAVVTDPATGREREATVGLVGLHIVRKLPGAAQFLWATFEQIDTVPDEGSVARVSLPEGAPDDPSPGFTYFNPACVPARDEYGCARNSAPGTPCRPGPAAAPSPRGCHPYAAPLQITRLTPIDREVDAATADAWAAIRRARPAGAPTSVFNYYRLVDVQWPAQDIAPVPPRATVPLPAGNMIPTDDTRIVANTTMETFVQRTRSCLDCHRDAAIVRPALAPAAGSRTLDARTVREVLFGATGAVGGAARPGRLYASDYSFVFANETRR